MNTCWVVECDGTNRATWECRAAGHRFRAALLPASRARGVDADGFKLLSRWWRKEAGGVVMECPRCKKKTADAIAADERREPGEGEE